MKYLNPQEICVEYLATLEEKQTINDTKNALIRYFIPSVGGPPVSAAKRRPVTPEDAEIAFEFLKQISLEQLANAPDWALKTLEEHDTSPAQKERVRRDLRNLVDWAREKEHLPPPHNPIPKGICDRIELGRFEKLNLKPATALDIYHRYLKQLQDRETINDTSNGMIRYFVPATGGPLPFHKPALNTEVEAALKHLERVPLEYLNEAHLIVISVLQALDMSETQRTRICSTLRDMVHWAREQGYLPDPHSIAPWGGEYTPTALPSSVMEILEVKEKEQTADDIYSSYCQHLQANNRKPNISSLQSIIIRYLIPACGGIVPPGRRASHEEIQATMNYLNQISLEQLYNAVELVELQFEKLGIEGSKRYTPLSRVKSWIDWADEQGYFNKIRQSQKPQPVFNTFYKNGVQRQKKKPGIELHQKRCPIHALCAKQFPDDYINPYLQQQIQTYKAWRLSKDVRPGAIKTEEEQILQLLGWLHRFESISLDELSFERIIAKSKLVVLVDDYKDYMDYLLGEKKFIQAARQQAEIDMQRVHRYIDFVGKHPESQKKRVSLIIAMGKFLYKDVIGTEDFPEGRDIPIIRRLLNLQVDVAKKGKTIPQSVSYHKTSTPWDKAVMTMEEQRRRAEQAFISIKCPGRKKGYYDKQRPNTALANELQRFLSIAFTILIPSRSRTFYDLRIGETFKEGILTDTDFLSVAEMKNKGIWNTQKDSIKFYIHHNAEDYKSGKSMAPVLINHDGWWAELPNIEFDDNKCLYDYIRRWLTWGRAIHGPVNHNYFFRHAFSSRPIKGGAWADRIKTMFENWAGTPVPPSNVRKMFASQFSEKKEAAALLLQHSEKMHITNYDMRHSINKMQPVMAANQQFIKDTLEDVLKVPLSVSKRSKAS
ncbi:hypothetical protein [Nostoc sp. C110]|uniref:hypothetical protein n=1 Tax=Nostoc sp. C110 TaxID=3349876 RepID=UPI00370D93CF